MVIWSCISKYLSIDTSTPDFFSSIMVIWSGISKDLNTDRSIPDFFSRMMVDLELH